MAGSVMMDIKWRRGMYTGGTYTAMGVMTGGGVAEPVSLNTHINITWSKYLFLPSN